MQRPGTIYRSIFTYLFKIKWGDNDRGAWVMCTRNEHARLTKSDILGSSKILAPDFQERKKQRRQYQGIWLSFFHFLHITNILQILLMIFEKATAFKR